MPTGNQPAKIQQCVHKSPYVTIGRIQSDQISKCICALIDWLAPYEPNSMSPHIHGIPPESDDHANLCRYIVFLDNGPVSMVRGLLTGTRDYLLD